MIMFLQKDKPLKIVNASAGSGKTFNLVKEYIQLLLGEENPGNRFSHIIAMTFTNKAALEMKSRIIQGLDELSFPEKYKDRSKNYAVVIGQGIGIDPELVHRRAKIVLQNILHRYEDFHVMTIDKFNLRLIRSFSRDLNLPNDFEIILNENEVIERVVDNMLNQLGRKDLEKLTQLVFSYARNNVEEGEKWDFRRDLIQFASILQKENYFSVVEQLMEMDFSREELSSLNRERTRLKDHFISQCQVTFTLFLKEDIRSDQLPGGSRTYNPIQKLATLQTIPKELFTKAFIANCQQDPNDKKKFPVELRTALLALQDRWDAMIVPYTTLHLFIKNFYNMALLQFMALQLESVRKEEQLIRISEFNKLISELVNNEEAPFIYERLGNRFHHFLLDEFQDTSHLQWINMVPLFHESIAAGNLNLIVGDPKQSIYRFKNGVAEQFVALPAIYNPHGDQKVAERSAYFSKMGQLYDLEDNWRSSPIIVQFNNHFFDLLKNELSADFQPFYASFHQNSKSIAPGLIEVISKEINKKEERSQKEQLIQWINACEEDGYKRGDICLLGNKNKECSDWAIWLSQNNYQVVSADSLLVDSDPAVQLTIAYLRRRLHPLSENEKRRFAELYFRIQPENSYRNYKSYLIEHVSAHSKKKYRRFDDQRFLADHFQTEAVFFSKFENLYDLFQKFFLLVGFNELTNPYLHHLADMGHEYDLTKGPDLKGFLEFYADRGKKSAVQLPESENAIRIMSIHKSKGLEFPVVILPSMNFDLALRSHSKFLIQTEDKILYTFPSKESPISQIKSFAEHEIGQIRTDSINKCYVAMTRPVERLYILNEYKKDEPFSLLFNSIVDQMEGKKEEIEGGIQLNVGNPFKKEQKTESTEAPHFIPKNTEDRLWFPDISLQDTDFLGVETDRSDAQRYGNQLHLILSILHDTRQLEHQIQRLSRTGEIEMEFVERLTKEIQEILENSEYQSLFANATEILSEQTIVVDSQTTIRPDKIIVQEEQGKRKVVVIDYKTGIPNDKHRKQVRKYASVLSDIYGCDTAAFLFFTSLKKLEQVC
jgi:ATP-dependent exoDNAse (exonuclease V) beta subunit